MPLSHLLPRLCHRILLLNKVWRKCNVISFGNMMEFCDFYCSWFPIKASHSSGVVIEIVSPIVYKFPEKFVSFNLCKDLDRSKPSRLTFENWTTLKMCWWWSDWGGKQRSLDKHRKRDWASLPCDIIWKLSHLRRFAPVIWIYNDNNNKAHSFHAYFCKISFFVISNGDFAQRTFYYGMKSL